MACDLREGRGDTMAQTVVMQMTPEHFDGWADLYNRFHGRFSWILPMDTKECLDLLAEGPASRSYVVLRGRRVVATATLDMRGSSTAAEIRNLAFHHGNQDAGRSLLNDMAAVAKGKGFTSLYAWEYDSVTAAVRLLNGTGFSEEGHTSLLLFRLDKRTTNPRSSSVVFMSLADGLSIDSFVEANRVAFEAEGYRLLESAELERWVSNFEGYVPSCQLAAQIGNAIVGTVMSEIGKVRPGRSLAKVAWVYGLGVIPDARRQGIGTGLMNELLKRLQFQGVCEVWLVTDAEGGIRAFYEQLGFRHHTYFTKYSRSVD